MKTSLNERPDSTSEYVRTSHFASRTMSCLSVCDSRTLVYAVPEHRSSRYYLPSVIKSDNVPTGGPRVQMSVSHSIAATLSPILGLASALIAWLVTAKKQYGELTVASTGAK